ncbi:MAG: hypothetical protein AAF412_09765, partial [Pseudomonadota bacterium]
MALVLEELDFPEVEFGSQAFGLASRAAISGKAVLDEGAMDVDLTVNRLDDVGGQLKAIAQYRPADKTLALDVKLQEPDNGMLATALDLEGRPPVLFEIKGNAPLSELSVDLAFDVASKRVLDGKLDFGQDGSSLVANAKLTVELQSIVKPQNREFFGPKSTFDAEMRFPEIGGFVLENSTLDSGALKVRASAETTGDGFLIALGLDANINGTQAKPVLLPTGEQELSLEQASLEVDYDASLDNNWIGNLDVKGFTNDRITIGLIELAASGAVENVDDVDKRAISFNMTGTSMGIQSEDLGLRNALGTSMRMQAAGDWEKNKPVRLSLLNIIGDTFQVFARGAVSGGTFDGQVALDAKDLQAFAGVAETDLGGAINISTTGRLEPLSGAFDINVDGTGMELTIGEPYADRLMGGNTRLTGGVSRTSEGLGFQNFRLANPQLESILNGRIASDYANLTMDGFIRDLKAMDDDSSGRVDVDVAVTGDGKPFNLYANVGIENGKLVRQRVEKVALNLIGKSDGQTLQGDLSSDGLLAGQAVEVSGKVDADTASGEIKVDGLAVQVGKSRINGFLQRRSDGLANAKLDVNSSDISAIAALGLFEASGALEGEVNLSPEEDGTQSVRADIAAKSLRFEENRIGSARLRAAVRDLFNQPKINALLDANDVFASGVAVETLNTRIENQGNTTQFDLSSRLETNNADIKANGLVTQGAEVTTIRLDALDLNSNITRAKLKRPTNVAIREGVVRLTRFELGVGSGSVTID